MPETPARLQTALADQYRFERALGSGGMATGVRGGRFFVTLGDLQSDIWVAEVGQVRP